MCTGRGSGPRSGVVWRVQSCNSNYRNSTTGRVRSPISQPPGTHTYRTLSYCSLYAVRTHIVRTHSKSQDGERCVHLDPKAHESGNDSRAARRAETAAAPPSFDYRTVSSSTVEVRGASRAAGRRARRRRAPRRSRRYGGPAAFGLGVGLGLGIGLGLGLGLGLG